MNYLRRLPKFTYQAPKTVAEVCDILAEHQDKAAILAGGTDLFPKMKHREKVPEYLISLTDVPDLDRIQYSEAEGLRIGARVTIHDVEKSAIIREKFPALAQAAAGLASAQIRNLATVAGNLRNAVPCADTPPSLMALGGRVKLISSKGQRTLGVEEISLAPFKSAVKPDELITEIEVPEPAAGSRGAYLKHAFRGAMDYPLVGIAVVLTVQDGICRDVRITGSFCHHCFRREGCKYPCPTPFRATRGEEVLRGKPLEERLIRKAALMASKDARAIVNPQYTKEMVGVFTRRAVTQAWKGVIS